MKETIPEMDVESEEVKDLAAFKRCLLRYPRPKAMIDTSQLIRKTLSIF